MTGVAIRLARPDEIDALVAIDDDACTLAARGETPTAFDGRCIPPLGVARRSNIPDILPPPAWIAGRLARLGAARAFHHGLPDAEAGLVMALDASHPFVVGERARWVAAIARGLLEVAETPDGTLAGFAARGIVDGEPYLDQLSVRRAWMRRGIGTSLLCRAIAWGAADPSRRLWLTTWTHVPWNAPFYARHGFVAHPEAACGPELRDILRRQRDVLPDPDRRIAMVHPGCGVTPQGSRASS